MHRLADSIDDGASVAPSCPGTVVDTNDPAGPRNCSTPAESTERTTPASRPASAPADSSPSRPPQPPRPGNVATFNGIRPVTATVVSIRTWIRKPGVTVTTTRTVNGVVTFLDSEKLVNTLSGSSLLESQLHTYLSPSGDVIPANDVGLSWRQFPNLIRGGPDRAALCARSPGTLRMRGSWI